MDEARGPPSSAWNIALGRIATRAGDFLPLCGRKTISVRWRRDVARVSFLLLTSSVSSTFHQGRIESSRERSITPSRGPSIHLPVSLLSPSGRQVGLLRKRERGRKVGSHSPAHNGGHELYVLIIRNRSGPEYSASMKGNRLHDSAESSPKKKDAQG